MPAARRAPARPTTAPAGPGSTPMLNAALVAAALAAASWLLVVRGRMAWPPHELLDSAYTLAGCLALVGPVILARRGASEAALGDLLWLTAGLLVWVFDLSAALRGEARTLAWATPLDPRAMGLTVLAVLLAGWRAQGAGRSWSWTNVVGWVLSLFWVVMAARTFLPARPFGLVAR